MLRKTLVLLALRLVEIIGIGLVKLAQMINRKFVTNLGLRTNYQIKTTAVQSATKINNNLSH
jgi:hypothetical protein